MEIYQGIEGFGSVALGSIKLLKKPNKDFHFRKDAELSKYQTAKEKLIRILQNEQESTLLMLLQDHQLEDAIIGRIITQKIAASQAISEAGRYFEDVLIEQSNEYLRAKRLDMRKLSGRLLSCMEGYSGADVYLQNPVIIAAHTLSSAEFLQLDKSKLLGLLVEESSINSHMAILAKAMNIPIITGCEILDSFDGKPAILDGGWRVLYLDPDEQTVKDMEERQALDDSKTQKLQELKGRECITKDGHMIHLYGNISSSDEVISALSHDAEGIGLYRSEVLYIDRKEAPCEEELFEEYKRLITGMKGKSVTIRTVDIGMDKSTPYIHTQAENNAALGCRGIRLCLRLPELFKIQLRAILRAAIFGTVSIMYPMISSIKEILQANEILEECYRELTAEGIPFREVSTGVMIETPAAVMISDDIAKIVSFISIGTNDLTQYTLGVDRENKELSDICDYHHPAILKMIKMVVENGHRFHIPVGICGELASDEALTSYFLEIGVDDLSVAPAKILMLRNKIIEMDLGMDPKEELL